MDYYVISVRHTQRDHLYITVWAPENNGYRWALSRSGRYSEETILNSLDYYNDGSNVAVPCHVLDDIAVPPMPGHHDNDAGPCVQNNRANWQRILKNTIRPPRRQPSPEYKGARRGKEQK